MVDNATNEFRNQLEDEGPRYRTLNIGLCLRKFCINCGKTVLEK